MKNLFLSLLGSAIVLMAFSFTTLLQTSESDSPNWTEPAIGEISMFAGNFAPRGWALCNGQLLPINQNQALFSILGTTYGGDGRTTFGLPDLRGRAPVSAGQGPGLSDVRLGQSGGVETVTLNALQLPSHQHTTTLKSEKQNNLEPDANNLILVSEQRVVEDQVFTKDIPSSATGGNQAHENRPPYLGINYIIALQGIFPSRN